MSANGTVCKPFTLRLDDGSVITVAKDGESGSKITRLSGEEAVKAGKLGREHVQKIHLLVYKLECLAKGDSWVEGDGMIAFEQKRKADFGLVRDGHGRNQHHPRNNVQDGPDLKRVRSVAPGNGLAVPSPSGLSGDSWHPSEFVQRCQQIVQTILTDLGRDAIYFDRPVDKRLVPDYYTIIKNPMDLGTIKQKLSRKTYRSPQEFHDDVMQVWINCNIYNKKGDYVQKLGARAETVFSQEWARSGLSGGAPRAKRTTAGVAAEKYEPPLLPALPEKKRTMSGGPKTTSKVAPSRRGKDGDVSGRMWGNEHLTFISEALSSDQLTEQLMDQVLAIVKDHTTASSDEEVELDLDLLPKEALWKLYDLIVATMGRGVATPTTATPGGMAPADASDSDGASSDDDSD